jgi:hypothetical protein
MKNENIRNKWKEFIEHDKYKQYFLSNEEEWINKLQEVKLYMDKYNKRPSKRNKNLYIKNLGIWILTQINNYKNNKNNMLYDNIKKQWKEFIEDKNYNMYFLSNEQDWKNNFEKVKLYIDKYNKRPSTTDRNNEIKILGNWLSDQFKNFIKKKYIMTNENIRIEFNEFIKNPKYKKYFISNEEEWYDKLENVKNYINKNNKKPSINDKNDDIKTLGYWLYSQNANYKNKKYIMSNENIRIKWREFIEDMKYKHYFESNIEDWINKLENLKIFINENNKKPSCNDKNPKYKQLSYWLNSQNNNYINKEHIMKNITIRNLWEDFINDQKYKQYFITNEQEWNNKLDIVKKYIDDNNKRPSTEDKNIEIKQLGKWLSHQKYNYSKKQQIMINEHIRYIWENFINDKKYKKYFN